LSIDITAKVQNLAWKTKDLRFIKKKAPLPAFLRFFNAVF
jgi:hypothetical protein